MFNFKIIIEYDGTNYVGWQRQTNGISIQEAIENAIFKLTSDTNLFFYHLFETTIITSIKAQHKITKKYTRRH